MPTKLMKKAILSVVLLLVTVLCHGQEYKESQTVQTIVHKIIIPENGSLKEALELTQEWTENVLRKNENFENIQLLISDTEKDTIDLMVLYKYKLNIERNTNEINQELISQHWPEKGAFESFISKLHLYIDPKMNKRSVFKELVLE